MSAPHLDISADRALFEGRVQGLVVACPENERPLQGLAGLMDWRFQGAISAAIREGVVTGRAGECAYFPLRKGGQVYHLLLAGSGRVPPDRERGPLPGPSLDALRRNLATLKIAEVGISRADWGGIDDPKLNLALKGHRVWIAP